MYVYGRENWNLLLWKVTLYCFLTNEAATFVEFREFIILLFSLRLQKRQ